MPVKASASKTAFFATQTASTGAGTDADSTPSAAFYRNGTLDGAVTVTVSNVSAGVYKAAWAMPAGASEGDDVEVVASATVDSIAGSASIWRDTVVDKLPGDLNDIAATNIVSAGAITTSGGAVSTVTTTGTASSVTAIATGGIAAASFAAGAIDAASTSADFIAEINATVDTALADINLDHLAFASSTLTSDVDDDSIIGQILAASAVANFDRTTDSLQVIGGKVSLITSTGITPTAGIISEGDVLYAFKGKALNSIQLDVPVGTIDLSGYNATFGVTKLVEQTGTNAEQFNFTISDPGGANQAITGSIPKTSTAAWAVDNSVVVETATPSGYAYRWSIAVNNSHTGTAQAGGASSITLAADASSIDDFYNGQTVTITSGTADTEIGDITDYDGTTKIATVAWPSTTPDGTSGYHVAASDEGCIQLTNNGEISVTASDTNCGQPA